MPTVNSAKASAHAAVTNAFAYMLRLHILLFPYLLDVDGDTEREKTNGSATAGDFDLWVLMVSISGIELPWVCDDGGFGRRKFATFAVAGLERGLEFLGYHFCRAGLRVAKLTIAN